MILPTLSTLRQLFMRGSPCNCHCHCFDTMMVFSLFVGPKDRVYWMNATRFYLQYEWANWVYFRRRAVVPLTIDWSCTWTTWDLVAFEAFFPNTKCGKTPLAFFLPSAWQRTCDLCSNHFFPQHTQCLRPHSVWWFTLAGSCLELCRFWMDG